MDVELKARWDQMFVQAEGFEASDKIEEARARSRQALAEIEEAFRRADKAAERAEIERVAHRAARLTARYEDLYEQWQAKSRERHARFLEREEEAYHAPLPVPPETK